MPIWIRDPLAIMAANAERGVVVDGPVVVETVPAGAKPSMPCDVVDASSHVVVPGFVNTHHHFYQTLTRSLAPSLDAEVFPWLKVMYPVWRHLQDTDLRLAVRVALAELALTGCTTTSDHHYVFPPGLDDAIEIAIEEAQTIGLRLVLTRGSMDLSEEDGGLPPAAVVQSIDRILADSERLVHAHHDAAPGAMVQIALAPCSPFSVSADLMRESAALARIHGLRLHTHLAAHADEIVYCQDRFGCRPIDYMERLGWLGANVWLAHGIFISPGEMTRLGQAGVSIAHCPSSNMITASGVCPVPALEAAGVAVGLGVDGSSANDSSSMIAEIRQAFMLQRLTHGTRVKAADALRWATAGGATCLGRDDIGSLAPGRQADLAMFRTDGLGFTGVDDALAGLVRSMPARADRVMVAGRWVVEDGMLPGIDVAALTHGHGEAARRLRARAGL